MIQELFFLVKQLFKKPYYSAGSTVLRFKHFPFNGYSAMFWCGYIIARADAVINGTILSHERIHAYQATRYKRYIYYYLAYLWYWLKSNPLKSPSEAAYYLNRFEVEAYANELRAEEYIGALQEDKVNLNAYHLEGQTELYKAHIFEWKGWLRYFFKYIKK